MLLSRIVKILVPIFLVADAVLLAVHWSPARLLVMVAAGRSPCAVSATLHSKENAQSFMSDVHYFEQNSRMVEHDPAGLDLWETPKGRIWVPWGDTILPVLLAEQQQEIYGAGERGVRPADVVLDCGANVGMFTRTALSSGARLVVAIEPAPRTLECLRRNLASEIAHGRVIIYPKGVWDKDDVLNLALDGLNAGHNSLVMDLGGKESVTVPLTTIDKLVDELKLSRVDFIKMDIEGAEKRALAGARVTLTRFRPRLSIAAEHLPDDHMAIPAVVRGILPAYKLEHSNCLDLGNRVESLEMLFY